MNRSQLEINQFSVDFKRITSISFTVSGNLSATTGNRGVRLDSAESTSGLRIRLLAFRGNGHAAY